MSNEFIEKNRVIFNFNFIPKPSQGFLP